MDGSTVWTESGSTLTTTELAGFFHTGLTVRVEEVRRGDGDILGVKYSVGEVAEQVLILKGHVVHW